MEEMQDISNAMFSNNMIGLIVAAIIFIITIFLLIRKLIGVVITIILLFFAIISGLAIAHNDIVRSYLSNAQGGKSEDWEAKFNEFKKHLHEKLEEFKNKQNQSAKPEGGTESPQQKQINH